MRYFKNAPMLAYEAVYEKESPPIMGMTFDTKKKVWRGLTVDYHLKDEWLDALNDLPIEVKSTEEGKGLTRPAHVAFRMKDPKLDVAVPQLVQYLKEYGYSVKHDIGLQGRPRIIVASQLTPEDGEKWETWWNNLPNNILNSIKKLKG